MDGGHKERCQRRFHEVAAMQRDAEVPAEQAGYAVAPRQTMTSGRSAAISASSHGRHAAVRPRLVFCECAACREVPIRSV